MTRAVIDTAEDVAKAFVGIVVSIDLAVGLPLIARQIAGESIGFQDIFPNQGFMIFVLLTNAALIPVSLFAFSKPEDDIEHRRRNFALAIVTLLILVLGATFVFPILR